MLVATSCPKQGRDASLEVALPNMKCYSQTALSPRVLGQTLRPGRAVLDIMKLLLLGCHNVLARNQI